MVVTKLSIGIQLMKQYFVDEIRPEEQKKIKTYLEKSHGAPDMGSVFWVPIPTDMLSPVQNAHVDCQPFYFAVDLGEDTLSCELLIRTKNRIRCDCIGYATEKQRNWIIDVIDAIFEKLAIDV
jgi:hypothetical protein